MNRFYTLLALFGAVAFLTLMLCGLPPFAWAQSQEEIDEMCEQMREMDAQMHTIDDPQMRQMLEQQFAQIRQQCAPGFAERRRAQIPEAHPSTYGRYRLEAEQILEVNTRRPDLHFQTTEVRKTQAEFEIGPGTREFGGQGTLHYISSNGSMVFSNCQARFHMAPVTHQAKLSGRLNPDGNTIHILVTDLTTGGRSTNMNFQASGPECNAHVMDQMVPDDGVFVQKLPLRDGVSITEVTPPNGLARYTVKATLRKL